MTISRTLLFAMLVAGVGLTGCPGNGSHPTTTTPLFASSGSSPDKTHVLATRHGRPAMNSAPRETSLSTYSNPEEGISFRYPRYYALEEGDVEEHSFFLKRQEDLDIEQPGARLVATVFIPEDGYPNTTFVHGSLQLAANDSATAHSCAQISGSNGAATTRLKSLLAQGVSFQGTEWQYLSLTAGTQVLEREYAGFSNGTCYQFTLVVAAEAAPEPIGITKPADEARIMRHLEKILSSVQIQEKRAPLEELNGDGGLRL